MEKKKSVRTQVLPPSLSSLDYSSSAAAFQATSLEGIIFAVCKFFYAHRIHPVGLEIKGGDLKYHTRKAPNMNGSKNTKINSSNKLPLFTVLNTANLGRGAKNRECEVRDLSS